MTHTISNVRVGVPGDRRYVIKDIDCTSYPTGGIPLLAGDLGLQSIDFLAANCKENPQYFATYKDTGVPRRVYTLTITAGASTAGTITYTIDGVAVTTAIAGDSTDDTAAEVAGKIRTSLNASGWVTSRYGVSGTGAAVVLTAKDWSTAHSASIAFGSTGAAASAGVVATGDVLMVYNVIQATSAEASNGTDVGVIRVMAYGIGRGSA